MRWQRTPCPGPCRHPPRRTRDRRGRGSRTSCRRGRSCRRWDRWGTAPEVALRIHVEHQEVPILARPHLHLGAVTDQEPPVVVDPDLNRRVVPHRPAGGDGPAGGRADEKEGKKQGGDHGTSRRLLLQRGNFDGVQGSGPDGPFWLTASPVPRGIDISCQHLGSHRVPGASSLGHSVAGGCHLVIGRWQPAPAK